jgi:filamin
MSFSFQTGSPFLLNVSGEPSGRIRETLDKEMVQAEPVKKGTKCEFLLKIPGMPVVVMQEES